VILTAAATAFLLSCAPSVSPETMAGLIERESGWQQYAIGDNTAARQHLKPTSYFPTSYWDAVQIAQRLHTQGHDIDAGISQINDSNWKSYGLDEYSVFDPCRNVRVGSIILSRAYSGAHAHFPDPQQALEHALSAYNSGGYYASLGYADAVLTNARNVRFLQMTPVSTAIANLPPPMPVMARSVAPAIAVRVLTPRRPTTLATSLVVRTSRPRHPNAEAARSVLTWALPVRASGNTQ
jgi:type IV secretion system protein VirB1